MYLLDQKAGEFLSGSTASNQVTIPAGAFVKPKLPEFTLSYRLDLDGYQRLAYLQTQWYHEVPWSTLKVCMNPYCNRPPQKISCSTGGPTSMLFPPHAAPRMPSAVALLARGLVGTAW